MPTSLRISRRCFLFIIEWDTVHDNRTAVGVFQTVDTAQQGGFAGSGGPHDDHNLLPFDSCREVYDSFDIAGK